MRFLIDEIAAKVIQRIFSEYVAGRTPAEIAKQLQKDKIRTPSFHKKYLGIPTGRTKTTDECFWKVEQILVILERREYIGATVSLKSEKLSHKVRGQRMKPQNEWLVFEGTHTPIVDKGIFETVQKMRSHKRIVQRHKWKDQPGHENTFAGLVYCSNGHKLTFCPLEKNGVNLDHYKCNHYNHVVDKCTHSHYVRKTDLEAIVLADIQQLVETLQKDKGTFEKQLRKQYEANSQHSAKANQKQLAELKARFEQIDLLIANLYEDKIRGDLTVERFNKLSSQYESEQEKLTVEISKLTTVLLQQENSTQNIDRFLKLVDRFPIVEQLTPEVVNSFIARTTVLKIEGVTRARKVHLNIQYNFIDQTKTERE